MKEPSSVDDRYRSLLQKAVRRGHTELVFTASALIESQGLHTDAWFEKRAAFIVFGECWPLGGEMVLTRKFHSKVATLVRVARAAKYRDATGLGFLAYALARGDATVLTQSPDDRPVRLIAKAIQRPADYWEWISTQTQNPSCAALIANARRFRDGGRPHDKAVVKAAAYLSLSASPPTPATVPTRESVFPYWVVFDRHTTEGQRVLRDVARDLHIAPPQLEWSFYYFEGAVANSDGPSPWWQRYCRWHFDRIGLDPEEALLVWEPARAQIVDALAEESHRLQTEIYRWKISNLERVEALKREVGLFTSHIKEVSGDQSKLFS